MTVRGKISFKGWNLTGKHAMFEKKQCHMTNLGTPNGHTNKPKIQM